jgi:MFS family permease
MTASLQLTIGNGIEHSSLPRYGHALLEILNFESPQGDSLCQLDDNEWRQLLALCDASQLTLLLEHLAGPFLPAWIQTRTRQDLANNALRFERLKAAVVEIAQTFTAQSIQFSVLKGYTHSPAFTPDPLLRAQSDIDIWCLPETVFRARDVLAQLGYRHFGKSKGRHLDPLVREASWRWTGDYFAPDLPIPVDLHYELWDKALERFAGPNEKDIWQRRVPALLDDQLVTTLDLADTLTFAALHLMMHLLHGDLRLQRAWEIAYFLEHHARDDAFWCRWNRLYKADVRRTQSIVFLLASYWFRCRLPDAIAEESNRLPDEIQMWMDRYRFSPIQSLFFPNKDELWLNLALVPSLGDKVRVAARRLFPVQAALASNSRQTSGKSDSPGLLDRARLFAGRARHHVTLLPITSLQGLQWWWTRQQLGRRFLLFTAASAVFDFGEFVFFLLYNLFLLQSGYNERFIGQVAASFTAGFFLGGVPAAAITRRYNLRTTIRLAIVGSALAASLRILVLWPPALLALALLNGIFMSFWAVSMPPAVAGLTNERNRTFGFSLITSVGIGVGAIAGLAGGQLPHLFSMQRISSRTVSSQQCALLAGALCLLVAMVPIRRLTFAAQREHKHEERIYPQNSFVYAFMVSLFIWSLGTGGFNPFFNVFFSRHLGLGSERIGFIFSLAQIAQVGAVLSAPLLLKRVGSARTVAGTQLATAVMLMGLAIVSSPLAAAVLYVAYMAFQYASEPCLLDMLMSGVAASERSGASVMNFMVISLAGIVAAAAAGAFFSQIGYRPTLFVCAIVSLVAAVSFFRFVKA